MDARMRIDEGITNRNTNLLFFLFALVARERLELFFFFGFLLSLTGGHDCLRS